MLRAACSNPVLSRLCLLPGLWQWRDLTREIDMLLVLKGAGGERER